MNICFLARSTFKIYAAAIFHELKNKHDATLTGYFITGDERDKRFIENEVPEGRIYDTSEFLRDHWNQYTANDLTALEKKYDCAPIWSLIYMDRFLIQRDYQYCINVTAGLFYFFEEVFSKNQIDFYFSETIATLQCYIAYIVGKKYGVRYIAQMQARGLDSTHHYFLMDEFQRNINFHEDYLSIDYSTEEYERADSFLREFESRDIRPGNMVFTGKKPKFRLKYLALPALRVLRGLKKESRDPCAYIYYKSYQKLTDPLVFYFKYQRAKKYYQKADYNDKYVYFPLHYQPEASTIVCAQKYEKQLFFIDSWAKSLPGDTKLYVKEHYAILGHRDLSFYKELRKYPNVVIIDPWENSRKLIEHAEAVTTLTGTAGWEAMLLRKPVFLGGNIFFDTAPGVIKVQDIYLNYLPKMEKWKKPDRGEIVKYLCEYFRTLQVGNVCGDHTPTLVEPENISNIAAALYNQLCELESNSELNS